MSVVAVIEPTVDRVQSIGRIGAVAAKPPGGSRILTEWRAGQEQARRQRAANAEMAKAMETFRRHHTGQPGRRSVDAMVAELPPPAFGLVSGQRAHGVPASAGQRAFAAGGTDRLSAGWIAFSTGINADLEAALATLRARSRDWWMNTSDGERFAALVADNIVGPDGPRLQMRVKRQGPNGQAGTELDAELNAAVEAAYATWCEEHADVAGELTFAEICQTNVQSAGRDGEFLNRRVRGKQVNPHGYALQLLDVDRIDTAKNVAPGRPGENGIRLGVEINPLGRRMACWLTQNHPGDYGAGLASAATSERVLAENLFHGFVTKRPEQLRGYPWTAAGLKNANMLATYEQYALVAAKDGAARMGFYVTDHEAVDANLSLDQMKDATGGLMMEVEGGMIEALPPGVTYQEREPAYPHQNYQPFTTGHRRNLAASLNVAHHNLSGDMTGVNYSSARIAELCERGHWRVLQRWFIRAFVRPNFRDWLRCALLMGAIVLPSGRVVGADQFERIAAAASFQARGWGWVDPEADISAAAIAITYDLRSLRQICDENGVDLDEVLQDKAALKALYQAKGLTVPAWMEGGEPKSVLGAPKPAPAPKPPAPAPAGDGA